MATNQCISLCNAGSILATSLLLVSAALPVNAQNPESGDAETVARAIESCAPATGNTPHPLVPDFTIVHQVTGMQGDVCAYTQTMPGNMKMICALSENSRKEVAAGMRSSAASGRFKGGTADKPSWQRECEIELASGRRVPAAGKTRTK